MRKLETPGPNRPSAAELLGQRMVAVAEAAKRLDDDLAVLSEHRPLRANGGRIRVCAMACMLTTIALLEQLQLLLIAAFGAEED